MTAYAALDVSKKSTSIHVVDETGTCLWRGKALTDPDALAEALAPFAADLARVGLETGCWTTWLWHSLQERGLPVVCMDARSNNMEFSGFEARKKACRFLRLWFQVEARLGRLGG